MMILSVRYLNGTWREIEHKTIKAAIRAISQLKGHEDYSLSRKYGPVYDVKKGYFGEYFVKTQSRTLVYWQ